VEEISNIKIIGIDEMRPPKIQKEPYIDLFFKLSSKAPPAWCADFNDSMVRHPSSPKIKPEEGLYIETWVRKSDEIAAHLQLLKTRVAECGERYIEKLRIARQKSEEEGADLNKGLGEQGQLNRIIAQLDFDTPPAKHT